MPQPLTLILVEKTGELKTLNVKDYKEDELFKKCGFKKETGFSKQAEWPVKYNGQRFSIMMYGKDDGKANMENKYDFPPPVDNKLLFGCCVLVGQIKDDDGNKSLINLSIELWTKLYEKLFGGFEDLTSANGNKNNNDCDEYDDDADDDDDEDDNDELVNIPKSKKTKNSGYLKDGFVIDDEDDDINNSGSNDEYNSSDESSNSEHENGIKNGIKNSIKNKCTKGNKDKNNTENNEPDELLLDDIGSELSEDSYDYN